MDDIKARVAYLKAATVVERGSSHPSAEHLLRLAFAFECYAYGGFNCAIDVLRNPPPLDPAAPLKRGSGSDQPEPDGEPLLPSSAVH